LENTDHTLLVGDAAVAFAIENGFVQVALYHHPYYVYAPMIDATE
jgi:isoaspartyl peptidase/L-asparaginase-like protein (Ntn-hydrolase superfamily)